jgi:putative transposase
LIIESNGNTVENPKFLKHLEPRLIFKQKQLSKKQKGSNKRNKARIIFAKQHEKIANKRKDLLHKLSRRLINENQVIIAENLAVKNMMKNHKLAKAISDVSWGELLRQIEYKAKWYGRTFYQIDRFFPSSKTCNNCQFVVDKLPLNIRSWICPKCKTKLDRDLNAAKNIRDKGLSDLKNLSSKEELSVCGTQTDVKQKPEEAFSSVSKKKLKKQEKSKRREIQSES